MRCRWLPFAGTVLFGLAASGDDRGLAPGHQSSDHKTVATQAPVPETDASRVPTCTGQAPACGCGAVAACVGRRWTCLHPAESCNGRDDDCDGRVDEGGDALCDDGIGCTIDSCTTVPVGFTDPSSPRPGTTRTECAHQPVHSRCNDGANCSVDRCAPGGEFGFSAPDADGCVFRSRDAECDDGCHCNGAETCNPTGAGVTPLNPGSGCLAGTATCESDHNACTVALCCETSEACLAGLSPSQRSGLDTTCSWAETLGLGETVKSETGVAVLCPGGTSRLRCDDGNPCTKDSCDPARGCRHEPLPDNTELPVEDEGCTRVTCFGGRIRYGRNYQPDIACHGLDATRCSSRTCEGILPPAAGAVPLSQGTRFVCVRPTAAVQHARCDDNVFCNGAERCEPNLDFNIPGFRPRFPGCRPGVPVRCDDGLTCTRDSCDEAGRRCVNEPLVPRGCDVF